MRTALTVIAGLIAFVFAVLFVIATLLALPLFNAERQLFDPNTYKRALVEERLYERIPALAGEMLTQAETYNPCVEDPTIPACQAEGESSSEPGGGSEEGGGPPDFLKNLTPEQWEIIFSDLLPTPWAQTQAESLIDQVFAFLESDEATMTVTVSFVEVKARVTGPEGMQAALVMLNAMPPCTEAQLAVIRKAGPEAGPEDMPECRPPDELLEQIKPQIEKALNALAANIPDELNQELRGMGQPDGTPPPGESGPLGNDPRTALRILRPAIRLTPLLPLGLLLLVTLFGVRSLKGLLRWWGIPFLIVGVIGIGLALAAMPVVDWALATFVAPKIPGLFTPNLVRAGFDVGRDIVRGLVTAIGVEAGVIGIAGLGMLLGSFFVKPKARSGVRVGTLRGV